MPESKTKTAREFSAGGVVVRRRAGEWWMAAIEPSGRRGELKQPVLALPKGIIDGGERAEQAAAREVREETGITAELVKKLGDSKYIYVRSWGDGARVFKVVSFYLLRYRSGRIGNLPAATRHEVKRARWIRLAAAARLLTYQGDREMAARALRALAESGRGSESAIHP